MDKTKIDWCDRYLCKAKRTDNGEWIMGYVAISYSLAYIISSLSDGNFKWYNVDLSTLCQCTGLIDKNGKMIWENDIVKFKHGGEFSENGIYFRNYVVEFINTYVTYGLQLRNKSIHFPFKQATASMHDAQVIGNIFDNPELLEGGAE